MNTPTLLEHGYLTLATVTPELRLGDVEANTASITAAARRVAAEGAHLAVFPELSLTGYCCGDLFYQETLLNAARNGLARLAGLTAELQSALIVGLPLAAHGRLYNVAAFLANGRILGLVPKTHLPNTGEFYEQRWFAPARAWTGGENFALDLDGTLGLEKREIPFGTDLLFQAENMRECVIGIEICEDLWAVEPPSGRQALAGATLICNTSAGNELLGKSDYRRTLVTQQSARCLAAYAYANSGPNESSTDVVFSGHGLIAQNGKLIAESERFSFEETMLVSQVDIRRLLHERRLNSTWFGAAPPRFRRQIFQLQTPAGSTQRLRRRISPTPFVPSVPEKRDENCREIFSIQAAGLARRIRYTQTKAITMGISGGLDSTLALLVAVETFNRLGLDLRGIHAATLPGPGTSTRTLTNARALIRELGVTLHEIPISDALAQHLANIGHPNDRHDLTYENAQARERTHILMDLASRTGGFVVGTGDLSEAALGWATFNGDHISMYHVNIGVPKTLVRHLVTWAAKSRYVGPSRAILEDICATPVSPELLPPAADGRIAQETEKIVGPYELHDFFLFHFVRAGANPGKILFLATHAFAGKYDKATLRQWLRLFLRRFFANQYKRSVMPDGPKVGSVALSPRGDWRMPSDAESTLWLKELDALETA
ncbi:MAG: NAD(+) synthase [Puniceicoccales bacterium]|jgi:NAD+ synthase (glutamine-hydrolysing)|nr:NAD(+) synthase [Puniceicoccales bacterium]